MSHKDDIFRNVHKLRRIQLIADDDHELQILARARRVDHHLEDALESVLKRTQTKREAESFYAKWRVKLEAGPEIEKTKPKEIT